MAMTPAQREAVEHRYNAGEDPKKIAQDLGIHHLAVGNHTRWMDIRAGKIPHPTKGKKYNKKPKPEAVVEETTGEPLPPLAAGAVPVKQVTETKRVTWQETEAPTHMIEGVSQGSPLFPSRPQNEIYRIEVKRVRARPASAGIGFCASYPSDVTEQDIIEEYGGGYYELRALNSRGAEIGSRSIRNDRTSKTMELVADEGSIGAVYPVGDNTSALAEFQRTMFDMLRRDQEAARVAHEQAMERERERTRLESERERERSRAEAERQQQHFASLNQQTQMFMSNMLQAAAGQKTSMKELVETLVILKDLTGDSEKEDDSIGSIAKAVITGGGLNLIGELAKSRPAAPIAPPSPQFKQQARSNQPNPQPQQQPQPVHSKTASYQRIAEEMYKRLIADGVDPAMAEQEVRNVAGYLMQKVAQGQAQKNGNGHPSPPAPPAQTSTAPETVETAS